MLCVNVGRHFHRLQVVLASLSQNQRAPGRAYQSVKAAKALDYFAVPEELWPTGLQLVQRASVFMQAAATDIVMQISADVLKKHVIDNIQDSRATWDRICFQAYYYLAVASNSGNKRYLAMADPGSTRTVVIPAILRTALSDEGKLHHLDISFNDDDGAKSMRVSVNMR